MRDIIGKYNRNRKIIWFIIGIIIAIISVIHIINNGFKEELNIQNNESKVINQQFYDTTYSVISSQKLDVSTSDSITGIIKQFINYCNEGKVEDAYNMLSVDCKNVLYPTLEQFKTDYYNNNFAQKKTYNLQSWITYDNKFTYMVELKEDILSTGRISNIKKQDYYTVVKENDNYYLNISGFVEKNIIKRSNQLDSIQITIESQEVFIDYLILEIRVDNKTRNKILLDSGENSDTVWVEDSEGIEYISYLFEKNNSELIIPKNSSKVLKIKFMKTYKQNRPIKAVVFEDIILNYQEDKSTVSELIVEL